MTTKLLTIIACLFVITTKAVCQQFEVPRNVQLVNKEDYAKYEKDIIAATDWMEATPVGTGDEKRKSAGAFVIQWITGSPSVTVTMSANFLVKVTKKNPELLIMFMAAYTREALQNNYDTSRVNGYIAGTKSMVALYKLGGKIKKDKGMEELVKVSDDGKLEDYVKQHMDDVK